MNNITLGKSKIIGAGRGVFAKDNIKKGELIEVSPAIKLSKEDTEKINETELINYMFYVEKNLEQALIVLGYGSIYNHSNNANAICKIRLRQKEVWIVAARDITKSEEICFDYNLGKKSDKPLWFE